MKTHKNKKNPSKNLRFLENSHFMKLLCTSLDAVWAAITLPLLNNSELIATAVRSLLCVSPRFL